MTPFPVDLPKIKLDSRLSIGMSAYGDLAVTRKALQHLFSSATGDFELLLVDNGAEDGGQTRDLLEQVRSEHANTRIFAFGSNIEYSGSVNAILSHARGEHVLFLSNDICVTPAYLEEMLDVARSDPKFGIVRGCSNFVDNRLLTHNIPLKRRVSKPEDLFAEAARIRSERHGETLCDDYLTGDAFLVSRALIDKIGTFDPLFFGYFADPDYGLRAQLAGFELILARGAFAWHEQDANFDYLDPDRREKKLTNRWFRVYENWARFKMKYGLPVELGYKDTSAIPWPQLRSRPFIREQVYCAPGDYSRHVVEKHEHAPVALEPLVAGNGVTAVRRATPFESRATERPPIVLKTSDGISITVPASLKCVTTYVLLEQEKWFEREVGFILRWLDQGMNAIDIGSNLGVFSLPMARRVGPAGKVFAFEPGGGNRRHLESSRAGNGCDNLFISACALSDSEREGWLEINSSGEFNSLVEASQTASTHVERVRISTVDVQAQEYGWASIDFVKIDAEGQEARIAVGGREFFRRQSPLVMYEAKHGMSHNQNLRWIFEALGYSTYRLLGDASFLVPLGSDESLDSFELNLFAAKPDRAASLAFSGRLVSGSVDHALSDAERDQAVASMLGLPYARCFEFAPDDIHASSYGEALIAYAAYRFVELAPARRYAALCAAFESLSEHCKSTPTPTGIATLVRVALDLGQRHIAVDALVALLRVTDEPVDQPFFPPCLRYEDLPAEGREAEWFSAAAIEQLEMSYVFSSQFGTKYLGALQALCTSYFGSAEISRRTILRLAKRGMSARDLSAYLNPGHQHRNPSFWSSANLADVLSLL
jgi:FkbM family methyltransferase